MHNFTNAQTVNFDEPFGTQSWTEDGHPWSWDNSGWDNIRNYTPHTGTGHAMSAPGYSSKLSTDANINIQGVWLMTGNASNFSHLNLKGYNECGVLIYNVSLNPADYQFSYAYVTLNWVNVRSFMVDFNSTDPLYNPVDLSYDDLDYTYIPPTNVLNFDQAFGTRSWTEDGHPWSWDNSGWDNIRDYLPHSGTGHAMSAPGYHAKLSTDVNIDIHGLWLQTQMASDFTHLNLKGFDNNGALIYNVSLNPTDYQFSYVYVSLNWIGVKSFMVDYNSVDPMYSPVDLFYDDMDYSYSSKRSGVDIKSACDSYTWMNGVTYTSSNSTALFTIPGGSSNGCDSIVHLNLSIYQSFALEQNENICQGDIFTWRGIDYSVAGTYYDSLQTPHGCDSVYKLNLTIKPAYEYSQSEVICNGGVFNWRGHDYTVAGTYYDSLQTQLGCDSVYKLNLTINPVYEYLQTENICQGDVFSWRGNDYTMTGIYHDSLQTLLGCDSVYTLNLTVNPLFDYVENKEICDGDILNWHGNMYSSAGTYYDSLLSVNGCDSVYTLNLIVNPVFENVQDEEICDGDVFLWHGIVFSETGTYYDSLLTPQGCDYVFKLNLTVNPIPPTPAITVTGTVLSSDAVSGNQWYDQNGIIAGATNQNYSATVNGDYFVIVTLLGCSSDSSNTIQVTSAGIESVASAGIIKVYPNPVSNELTIESNQEKLHFEILNAVGQVVYSGCFDEITTVPTNNFEPGVYVIKFENSCTSEFQKIIKQ
ncbi:MAG: hypothetical protein A2W93_11870 [Bacteroidetes bacterium GWF2_43_63]|nr:MAG: hypothetical protein A2W94_00405 [Bacteroidetes bacterium GWE2_42_42]OFY55441.1 MAG: hypothetical protein A2W93_11870 [Bacteroidetes bacterium GWF2_43_63]